MDSFGFVEAMKSFGVERRLYTAGDNKALLDPFLPEQPEQVAFMSKLLGEIHQQFINAVKTGRGERLQEHPDVFSGLVWSGASGVEFGLIDGLADRRYVAKQLIGAETMLDYTPRQRLLEQLTELARIEIQQTISSLLSLPGGWR